MWPPTGSSREAAPVGEEHENQRATATSSSLGANPGATIQGTRLRDWKRSPQRPRQAFVYRGPASRESARVAIFNVPTQQYRPTRRRAVEPGVPAAASMLALDTPG